MDLSKLAYTKADSGQMPKEPIQKTSASKVRRAKSIEFPVVDKAYQKQDGILSASLIFVLSGGSVREKNFLKMLINQREFHSLRVAFLSKENQGFQPYQMQEKWQEIRSSCMCLIDEQCYHLDELDKVFLLTDVDEYYNQLVTIISGKTQEDYGHWIISNPCFEIWLYYCYKNEPLTDLACLQNLTVDKRSKKLKMLGNMVVNGGLNPIRAFEHLYEGIENSLQHYAEDENTIPVLFATQIHRMAQFIVDALNSSTNEYEEFIKKKAEWRKRMK